MNFSHRLSLIVFLFLVFLRLQSQNINDCIIRYGIDDFGPFQPECLNSRIIGYAYLSNMDVPDIFTYSNNNKFFYCEAHARTSEGIPVYKSKKAIAYRGKMIINQYTNLSIVQTKDNKVHLFYQGSDNKLWHAEFSKASLTFINESSSSYPYPSNPSSMHAYFDSSDNLRIVTAIRTKSGASPPGDKRVDPFHHYDGAGIWLGRNAELGLHEIAYQGMMNSPDNSRLITPTGSEILSNCAATTSIYYTDGAMGDVVAGSRFGNLTYYKNTEGNVTKFQQGLTLVNRAGYTIRNPAINAAPLAFPNASGKVQDLMTAGEGGYYYFKFTGQFTDNGHPVYENPTPILYKNAEVHGGTLPVPTLVDWDKDGLLDIVVGSSEGFIFLYRNKGTNELPLFEAREQLKADGEVIQIQPGYYEDIQGVGESRWGYVGPNVVDWNGDGYWDVLTNDSRSRHSIFLGSEEGLQDEKPLYVNDLELRGTWRCRPGVGTLNGEMVYITLDDQDELHLYKRIDNYHLEDAGKIMMTNGLPIIANNLQCGGTGRLRVEIADWDGDGVKDLLLSTCKNASVPNPVNGLPWFQESSGKGSTILFLRNEGSEEHPVYAYPQQFSYGGKFIHLGHHACGAATGMLGTIRDNLPNILVFDELGRGFLLPRSHLSHSNVHISGVPVSISVNAEIKSIDDGVSLYSDQETALFNVASGLMSNDFTQWEKSELPAFFAVKAKANGNIYVAVNADSFPPSDDGTEWKKLTTASFAVEPMVHFTIFTREIEKEEIITIPSIGNYGSILLASNISFFCENEIPVPGLLIHEANPLKGEYISSSEIIRLSDGNYLGIYNVHKADKQEAVVVRSTDDGGTWQEISTMDVAHRPSIIEKAGVLFLIASDVDGNVIVRKSSNNGSTWTKSTNGNNGIVFQSNGSVFYESCSSPAILHGNRLWKVFRVRDSGNPDVSTIQLLSASYYSSWDISSSWSAPSGSALVYENSWKEGTYAWGDAAILSINDQLKIVAGVKGDSDNIGALINVHSENRTISFSASEGYFDFPGGHNPFTMKTFSGMNGYWNLSNTATGDSLNKLSLFHSSNLTKWVEKKVLFPNDVDPNVACIPSGWLLGGEDIVVLLPITHENCFGSVQEIEKSNKIVFKLFTDALTSINPKQINKQGFVIYPNPAKHWFVINMPSPYEGRIPYVLCDLLGSVMREGQVISGEKIFIDLPQGMYFIMVNDQINKLIIQ